MTFENDTSAGNEIVDPKKTAATDAAGLWFTDAVMVLLRETIERAGSKEVFCIGTIDESGYVFAVEHLATGNEHAVPAPAQGARPGQVLIHNHPSGYLDPSDPDINLASAFGRMGVGFFIVNNGVSEVRVVVKPFKPKHDLKIDEDKLIALISGQRRDANGDELEHRPAQVDMMRQVTRAFNEKQLLIVEAGTGTGKSFAYLAPAIAWAVQNKERVLVTTSTIPLQEQLLHKDIPALQAMMDIDVKARVMKGRGQFISKRRLELAAEQTSLIPTEQQYELLQLKDWADKSSDGSRSDLSFQISEEVWDLVASDRYDCLRSKCPNYDTCFYFKMQREAASADVVIANHSLVMSDLALRAEGNDSDFAAILPPHRAVIVDEAHNLEETASRHFSSHASDLMFRRILNQLYHVRNGSGNVRQLYETIKIKGYDAKQIPKFDTLDMLLNNVLPGARMELDNTLRYVFTTTLEEIDKYFKSDEQAAGTTGNDRDGRYLRLDPTFLQSEQWVTISVLLENLCNEATELVAECKKVIACLQDIGEDAVYQSLENSVIAFKAVCQKVEGLVESLRLFMKASDEEFCRWFEMLTTRGTRGTRYVVPYVARLDVSASIKDGLLTKKEIVVMTSATLTVDNEFHYFSRQIGLKESLIGVPKTSGKASLHAVLPLDGRVFMYAYASPFNYKDNCKVAIAGDMPDASVINNDAENGPLLDMMCESIKITHGRALCLFTSFRSMKKSAEALGGALRGCGIDVFVQGEKTRSMLLDDFRNAEAAALFATTSFWEGVDVRGNSLTMLIIHKLPFAVPTEPLAKAKSEAMVRAGLNPFMQMSLPQAVIKLKQGFGRLIRSKSDYGIVVLLDNRLLTKYYGGKFLRSLPPAEIIIENASAILPKLEQFIQEREGER